MNDVTNLNSVTSAALRVDTADLYVWLCFQLSCGDTSFVPYTVSEDGTVLVGDTTGLVPPDAAAAAAGHQLDKAWHLSAVLKRFLKDVEKSSK